MSKTFSLSRVIATPIIANGACVMNHDAEPSQLCFDELEDAYDDLGGFSGSVYVIGSSMSGDADCHSGLYFTIYRDDEYYYAIAPHSGPYVDGGTCRRVRRKDVMSLHNQHPIKRMVAALSEMCGIPVEQILLPMELEKSGNRLAPLVFPAARR